MPIATLIASHYKEYKKVPEKKYKFELDKEETEKFKNEFLKDFWDGSKIPEDEEAIFTVKFTVDFFKKETLAEVVEDANLVISE